MTKILRAWKTPHGGYLALTDTEIIDLYRGNRATWSYEDFLKKTSQKDSLSYRMIYSVFGKKIVEELRNLLIELQKDDNKDRGASEGSGSG